MPPSLESAFAALSRAPSALATAPAPLLDPTLLRAAVAAVSAATGICPRSTDEAESRDFLSDWFRWEARLRGVGAGDGGGGGGGVGGDGGGGGVGVGGGGVGGGRGGGGRGGGNGSGGGSGGGAAWSDMAQQPELSGASFSASTARCALDTPARSG